MEIITGVERRRRWRAEDKLRIVAECDRPGANITAISRRHDISRGQLWRWRQEARLGRLQVAYEAGFLPLQIISDSPLPPTTAAHTAYEIAPYFDPSSLSDLTRRSNVV